MNISTERLVKAKTAKSAEELIELAKAENIEITAEEAKKAYADLHKSGELSDDELDNVAAGSVFSSDTCYGTLQAAIAHYKFEIGQKVEVDITGWWNYKWGYVIERTVEYSWWSGYRPKYKVRFEDHKIDDKYGNKWWGCSDIDD